MKFTCDTKALKKALKPVLTFCKHAFKHDSFCLITADKTGVTMLSAIRDYGVKVEVPDVIITTTGSVLVDAAALKKAVESITTMLITVDEGVVIDGDGKLSLQYKTYPHTPTLFVAELHTICTPALKVDCDTLKALVQDVSLVIKNEKGIRSDFNTVMFKERNNAIELTATNGIALVHKALPCQFAVNAGQVVMPSWCADIIKHFTGNECILKHYEHQLYIKSKHIEMFSNMHVNYPDFSKILYQNEETWFTINTKCLLACLKNASKVHNVIHLKVLPNTDRLCVNRCKAGDVYQDTVLLETTPHVNTKYTEVCLDAKHLINCLTAMDKEAVDIGFIDRDYPALITSGIEQLDINGDWCILMPRKK